MQEASNKGEFLEISSKFREILRNLDDFANFQAKIL